MITSDYDLSHKIYHFSERVPNRLAVKLFSFIRTFILMFYYRDSGNFSNFQKNICEFFLQSAFCFASWFVSLNFRSSRYKPQNNEYKSYYFVEVFGLQMFPDLLWGNLISWFWLNNNGKRRRHGNKLLIKVTMK